MRLGGRQSSVSYILSTFAPQKQSTKRQRPDNVCALCFLLGVEEGWLNPGALLLTFHSCWWLCHLAEAVNLLPLDLVHGVMWGSEFVRVTHLSQSPLFALEILPESSLRRALPGNYFLLDLAAALSRNLAGLGEGCKLRIYLWFTLAVVRFPLGKVDMWARSTRVFCWLQGLAVVSLPHCFCHRI